MARVFCTLKEAAAWLGATEPDLKTMLAEGVLPEFRDGGNRLLRITDVRALAITRFSDDQEHPTSRPRPPADTHYRTQEAYMPDIRLPRSGTAVLDAPACDTGTQRQADDSEPSSASSATAQTPSLAQSVKTDIEAFCEEPQSCRCRQVGTPGTRMSDYAPRPAWPSSRVERTPVRKSLWIGVIEDRPSAIITLTLLVIGVASAFVAGAYALVTLLR